MGNLSLDYNLLGTILGVPNMSAITAQSAPLRYSAYGGINEYGQDHGFFHEKHFIAFWRVTMGIFERFRLRIAFAFLHLHNWLSAKVCALPKRVLSRNWPSYMGWEFARLPCPL